MQKKNNFLFFLCLLCSSSLFFLSACSQKQNDRIPALPDLSQETTELSAQLRAADKQARKQPSARHLGALGMTYYASNFYNKAEECFELAIDEKPDDWQWHYYLGALQMELGQATEAAATMNRVTQLKPDAWTAWYRLGDLYQQMDSTQQAEQALNTIIQTEEDVSYQNSPYRSTEFPIQLYARVIQSKVLNTTNRQQAAQQEMEAICSKHPTFGPAFRQLGALYFQKGEKKKGNKYQDRANDLRVYSFPVDTLMDRLSLMSHSEAYVLKQIDNAVHGNDSKWSYELIRHALQNIPDSKYVLSKAIRQYCVIGMGQKALPLLDRHFEYFKEDYDEMLQVGIRLSGAGHAQAATRYFEQALTFEDQTPAQKATLAGMFLENARMPERAVEVMTAVAEEYPDEPVVLGDAAFLMLITNHPDKALDYFTRLKRLAPEDPKVQIIEGMQAEKNGDIRRAIALFETAYEKDPKDKFLKTHMGELYIQQERWAESIQFARKALQAYPNDSELQMYLGLMLVTCPDESLRNLEEGKEYAERAFYNSRYTNNTRISAGRTLAIAHQQSGDKINALYYLNKTIEIAVKAGAPEGYIQGLRNLALQF